MAQFEWRSNEYIDAQKDRLERGMKALGLQGERILKADILNQPGDGIEYPRGKKAVHVASSPGNPPAPDRGALRQSVTHEVVVSGDAVIARVTANREYALALELGTEKIRPRPFMRPALLRLRNSFAQILRRFL